MKRKPNWQIALACYLVYLVIVIGAMLAGDTNYLNMTGADVIAKNIVLPLALGAVFLIAVISWLGWWDPVMRDSNPASPRWLQWPVILVALAFIAIGLSSTTWSNIGSTHLVWLVAAAILVGFNEEALTRGIVVVGFREGGHSEAWVLLTSSALFGLLHLPNALIGLPVSGVAFQVLVAAIAGAGFYVLRRTSGTLVLPMVIHGLWDLSTFSHGASGAEAPGLRTLFQFGSYGVAIICSVILLRTMRGRKNREPNS